MVNSFKRWLTRPNFPFHSGECEASIYAAFQNKTKDKSKKYGCFSELQETFYRYLHLSIYNNMLLYVFCSRCLKYIRCCGVTVHTCPTSKQSIRIPGQFFHRGSDYSPGDCSKHSHSFLSHSARMFLPSHISPPIHPFNYLLLSLLSQQEEDEHKNKTLAVFAAWRGDDR